MCLDCYSKECAMSIEWLYMICGINIYIYINIITEPYEVLATLRFRIV